jgi:hypothetical protein
LDVLWVIPRDDRALHSLLATLVHVRRVGFFASAAAVRLPYDGR